MPIGYNFACYFHGQPVRLLHLEADAGMYCPVCKTRWTYRELAEIGELGCERAPAGSVSLVTEEAGALDIADAE